MKEIIGWLKNNITFKESTIKFFIFLIVIVFMLVFNNKEVQETLFNFFN